MANFKLVLFKRDDALIPMLDSWWVGRSEHKSNLRITGTDFGFMVEEDEVPLVATFLYPIVGSSIALIGLPISNPEVDKAKRREALGVLVASVEATAKSLNYGQLITYAGSKGAEELFSRLDYTKGDVNATNYFKIL